MRKVGGALLAATLMLPIGLTASPARAGVHALTCTNLTGTAQWVAPAKLGNGAKRRIVLKVAATVSGCRGRNLRITRGEIRFVVAPGAPENCATLIPAMGLPMFSITRIVWNTTQRTEWDGEAAANKVHLTSLGGFWKVKVNGNISNGGNVLLAKTIAAELKFTPQNGGCTNADLATASVALLPQSVFTIG